MRLLDMLQPLYATAVEPVAVDLDAARRADDPETGAVHTERAHALQHHLTGLVARASEVTTPDADDYVDDAQALLDSARVLLRGFATAIAEDVMRATHAGALWAWNFVDRTVRRED